MAEGSESFAVIKSGGKQFTVKVGARLAIPTIEGNVGDVVTFSDVLLIGGSSSKVGAPLISGASVSGKIVEHFKTKKVITYKKKIKCGYTKKQGHRQAQTRVEISAING